ncbi:MAG: GPR endopeptidase [Oscillospiraceae bacterium]|nr:GPR endopeptidase [Oscillospiraceae bacterium]
MLQRRTDLAVEAREIWQETAEETSKLDGVEAKETTQEGFSVTTVRILNEAGARALGKPVGTYVTLELDGLERREDGAFSRAAKAMADNLAELLSLKDGATALVVGLGNRAITPDAIGPRATEFTLVTRHLVQLVPEHFGHFRAVSALAAGVLGTTGMESGELVSAVAERLKPDCILAVDALASRSLRRVCHTVQLADTGIVPGSGVGNSRAALNRETMGVPVIAIGVPTVVSAATLACDLLAEAGNADLDPETLGGLGEDLIVTPKDIDAHVEEISKVVGFGINLALQKGLSVEDIEMLL